MRFIALMVLSILLLNCQTSRKKPKDFDYGNIEQGVYTNKFFDFELAVPADWSVQDKEQTEQIRKQGRELLAKKNKKYSEVIKPDTVSSATLLTVFRNPTDSLTGEFNHSFVIVAENLGTFLSVNSGGEYLRHAREMMRKAGLNYAFRERIDTEKFGNRQFDRMEVTMTINGIDAGQLYYTTIRNGFALSIIASFANDMQKKELKQIFASINFR